jgi:hypothetical protein
LYLSTVFSDLPHLWSSPLAYNTRLKPCLVLVLEHQPIIQRGPHSNLISPFLHLGQLLIDPFWVCGKVTMLCEQCSRINFFLTEDAKGYHHETVGRLHQSVLDGCEFCRVLYDGFQPNGLGVSDEYLVGF